MIYRTTMKCVLAFAALAGLLWAQPKPKSQKEVDAIMAMQNAPDPDSRIKAGQELITKFADTEFKAVALQMIAMSYQQKNDVENMILWSERLLEADKKNFSAMLMIAQGLAQRTREFDLDKEEKLGRAEKFAKEAQEVIKTAVKPGAHVTDEQWEAAKKDFTSQAFESLGMVATARKKYDEAIASYKTAIEATPTPDYATMVRLGSVYNLAGKPDDAIAILDKVLASPEAHPTIKQFAQNEKNRAAQAKGAAKP